MADHDEAPPQYSQVEPTFIPLRDGVVILGLQFLLLVFRLGQVPLLGPDEPRYARVAVEMARANEFVTPTLAGEPWLEKPPLYYWLAGLGDRLFGENEFAARWPAVFAALLLTGFSGLMGARLLGRECGLWAMIILATSPLTFAYGRCATMDMLVAAFITGACGLFILRLMGLSGRSAVPSAWVLMGLAVLAKGPIGFLIPIGVALLAAVSLGKLGWRGIVSPLGLGLFAALCAPWFIAIFLDQGFHFVEVFLLNHNLDRFTTTVHNHPGPFYYYLPVLFLGFFPWSTMVPLAFIASRRAERTRATAVLAWIVVPLALFSVAGSKLPGYILPCLPPAAILLALSSRLLGSSSHRSSRRAAGLLGLLVSATILALVIRGIQAGEPWGRSALTPALWLVATSFATSQALTRARHEGPRLLTIGAAGFLLLLTLVAPPVLDAMESGRRLFAPANGREVLIVGAWRTAWMSGYFYNDGKVREMASLPLALDLAQREPRLILFGGREWRQAGTEAGFDLLQLAVGPRGTVLARVSAKRQE